MKKIIALFTLWLSLFGLGLFGLGLTSAVCFAEDIAYLLTAASKGDIATVKAMLESGVNANTKDADDISALMYAARKDKADSRRYLLAKVQKWMLKTKVAGRRSCLPPEKTMWRL